MAEVLQRLGQPLFVGMVSARRGGFGMSSHKE